MTSTARPQDAQRLDRFLQRHPHVTHIDAVFFDINATARGKRLPREQASKLYAGGLTLPRSLFIVDILGEVSNTLGLGLQDGDPDGIGVPLAGEPMLLSWAKRPCAQLLMDMVEPDGTPVAINPRYQLQRVVERFSARGLTPVCALELEFFLIDPAQRGEEGEPLPPLSPLDGRREQYARVHDLEDLEAYGAFFRRLEDAASALRLPLSAASTEFAPGQFEVNLRHSEDALLAADHACLLRQAVVQTARLCGMEATFLSKPFAQQTGNGMHVHISLLDDKGRNIFQGTDAGGSPALRQALRGMQKLMPESMLIFAPHINAYRRFTAGGFAPRASDWSYNHRATALRVPVGAPENRRIEHRAAGADANPYLVLAAVLGAALQGLLDGVEADFPVTPSNADKTERADGDAKTDGLAADLPTNLPDALVALERATHLPGLLQEEYLRIYAAAKRGEYEKFMALPSPREFAWYL